MVRIYEHTKPHNNKFSGASIDKRETIRLNDQKEKEEEEE